MQWIRDMLARLRPSKHHYVVDQSGVSHWQGEVCLESVRWDDLVEVQILTTSDGPFSPDFYWMLRAADGTGCAVPGEAEAASRLLDRLGALPGFDHRAVIEAAGCTDDRWFNCWSRESSGSVAVGEGG